MTARIAPVPLRRAGLDGRRRRRRGSTLARSVESLGYSTLTMPDHFDDQLAPVPALMAAAAATTTLRVGALVWDNDYRHPVVLAKELATHRRAVGRSPGDRARRRLDGERTTSSRASPTTRQGAHRPLRGRPRRDQGRDVGRDRSRSHGDALHDHRLHRRAASRCRRRARRS